MYLKNMLENSIRNNSFCYQKKEKTNLFQKIFFVAMVLLALCPLISASENEASFRDAIIPFFLLFFLLLISGCSIKGFKSFIPYFLLWLLGMVSTLFSPFIGFESTAVTYLLFCVLIVLTCILSVYFSKKMLSYFVTFYIVLSLICALLVILSWVMGVQHGWNRYSIDVIGVNKNQNYINEIILLGYAFLLNRTIRSKKRLLLRVATAVVIIWGVVLTGTRAALFTVLLLTGLSIVYILFVKRKLYFIFIFVAVAVAAFFLFQKYIPDYITDRITGENALSDDLRITMWKSAFQKFLEYPVLGIGINGTTVYNTSLGYGTECIHNVLLQFLVDQGILSALVLLFVFLKIVRRTKKKDRFFIITMFVALYFPMLFQNGLVTYTFWWPLLVLELFSRTSEVSAINA